MQGSLCGRLYYPFTNGSSRPSWHASRRLRYEERKALVLAASGGTDNTAPKGAATNVNQSPVAIELRSRLQETQIARQREGRFDWLQVDRAYVKLPAGIPEGVVHFVGGAVLGTYPQIAYDDVLQRISDYGSLVIIATPYDLETDHRGISERCKTLFDRAVESVGNTYTGPLDNLPLYGIGHSLGAKVQALITCEEAGVIGKGPARAGNAFVAFNNFSSSDSVDIIENLASSLLGNAVTSSIQLQTLFRAARAISAMGGSEFSPSPLETNKIIKEGYNVSRTRIYKFSDDTIDQSDLLNDILRDNLAANCGAVSRGDLNGNHLSPVYVKLQPPEGVPPEVLQGLGLGLGSEIVIGDAKNVEALAMDIVSFIKGFE